LLWRRVWLLEGEHEPIDDPRAYEVVYDQEGTVLTCAFQEGAQAYHAGTHAERAESGFWTSVRPMDDRRNNQEGACADGSERGGGTAGQVTAPRAAVSREIHAGKCADPTQHRAGHPQAVRDRVGEDQLASVELPF